MKQCLVYGEVGKEKLLEIEKVSRDLAEVSVCVDILNVLIGQSPPVTRFATWSMCGG